MWAEATSLLENLPHGGAVVAVIAIVVLFLRKQAEDTATFRAVAAEYRVHMAEIMGQGLAAHRETRDAIRSLDATIASLRESLARPEAPR